MPNACTFPQVATRTHTTNPGESIRGVALRQLGNESRWREIYDLNAPEFLDMNQDDYYPTGTLLSLPAN